MGLPLRITFKDNDYVYQIVNSKLIDQYTTEFDILLNGDKISLIKDEKKLWVQKDEVKSIDPELVHALGRSVSLRLRLWIGGGNALLVLYEPWFKISLK